ncbi:MAG: VIT1/CCC1 transporter family protein [Pseudomonadota bacterium]
MSDQPVTYGPIQERFRRFLPELIYGANDGVVTTLAIIAGVVGADLSTRIILILGFANLFADGVSMGASKVLSERSRIDIRPTLIGVAPQGIATFLGFFVAGLMPLLAYLVPYEDGNRFAWAVAAASLTLFLVGASRALVTDRHWLPSGIEMLVIGAAAGGIAYAVGVLGAALTGI